MKRHLLILNIALLATWHTKGASTSEDSSLVAVTELAASLAPAASSQPVTEDFSVAGFLDKLSVNPTILPLSREAYYTDNHHEFNTEIGRLVSLQLECSPLLSYLYYTQPIGKKGIDNLAHMFAVSKILLNNLFNPPAEFSKSSFTSQSSTRRKTMKEILLDLPPKSIAAYYFASLDDQPQIQSGFKGCTPADKTAASLVAWYKEFKEKQISGEITAEENNLHDVIEQRFEAQRQKLLNDRERTLAFVRPGLEAHQALIELAYDNPAMPPASSSQDRTTQRSTNGCLLQ